MAVSVRQRWPMVVVSALCVAACAGYTGTARPASPAELARDPQWTWVRDVPFVEQRSERDCGVSAAAMVAGYWGGETTHGEGDVGQGPVPADGLTAREVADRLGAASLEAFVIEGRTEDLARELRAGRPVIVGVAKPYGDEVLLHYEVVVGVHGGTGAVATIDPAHGLRQNTARGFAAEWEATNHVTIVAGPVTAPRADPTVGQRPDRRQQ